MKRAWLYCTFDFLGAGPHVVPHVVFLAEVKDEGSMRDLVREHCTMWGDEHADHIHLIVEGTPECDEAERYEYFPVFLPDEITADICRRYEVAS